MTMSLARFVALAASAGALAGCVTPQYGPIGDKSPYGYSDAHNADGSYTIRVVATTAAQAHDYWDRRAAELCGGPHFRKNIFRAEIPVVSYSGYATGANGYGGAYTEDRYGDLVLEGYLHCETESADQAAERSPDQSPGEPVAGAETSETTQQ
jgi:hypothetical protein